MHLVGHQHGANCGHHDSQDIQLNRSFAIAVVLNVAMVLGEVVAGVWSGSVALLADAGHNLSDVAGLLLAWWANWLKSQMPASRWTYGYRSFTMLAANINGILISVAILGVSFESIRRLFAPTEVLEWPVLIVAAVAALLNFASARLLSSNVDDLNVRGAYWHMMADAAVSVAVVIGALVMMATKWTWIDPVVSLMICVLLISGTVRLLMESTTMLMHAAPKNVSLPEIRQFFGAHENIAEIADLHVWSVSTSEIALTARVICPQLDTDSQDGLLDDLHTGLQSHFGISHATIEILRRNVGTACKLTPQSQEDHRKSAD